MSPKRVKKMPKKIMVALSGGIDSIAAAYLLKKERWEVTGLYFRFFCDEEKEKRVEKIAKALDLPLVVKDVRREFKKKVIGYFLREYARGRTPNPCVACNREIKFRFLFSEMKKMKIDYAATGHYARTREIKNKKSKTYKLLEAKDKSKDQSYFLHILNQKQLAKMIFPLGKYHKKSVRALIKNSKLRRLFAAVDKSDYRESQNACFIKEKYPDMFLKKNLRLKSGPIVDVQGNVLGQHEGLPLYTLGQRRGIKLGGRGPYFVIGKNHRRHKLIVSNDKLIPELFQSEAQTCSLNWISKEPKMPARVLVSTRYHNPKIGAIIKKGEKGRLRIFFDKAQRAVTPGQAAVFYTEEGEILGGGIIV